MHGFIAQVFPVLPYFSIWGWLAMIGGAFAIGLNKGGLAGLGVVPVLTFALVLTPKESTGFLLPLLVVGDLCAISAYYKVVIWRVFWNLLPATILGIIVGALLMNRISGSAFGPLIGWMLLGLIVIQLLSKKYGEKVDHIFRSQTYSYATGVLVGVSTMLANAAGPVAILYLLSVRLPKWNLIGTSVWFFFVINLCKLPFSIMLGLTNITSVSMAIMLSPLVVVGAFLGNRIAKLMPEQIFGRFLLICTIAGALKLIF